MSTDPMQKFGKEGMDMAMTAFGAWSKNAQAIATEVADYSKKSFEDSAAAFEKLMGAKSLEKAMEVQTEYLQILVRGVGRRKRQDRRAVCRPRQGSVQAVRKRADENAQGRISERPCNERPVSVQQAPSERRRVFGPALLLIVACADLSFSIPDIPHAAERRVARARVRGTLSGYCRATRLASIVGVERSWHQTRAGLRRTMASERAVERSPQLSGSTFPAAVSPI